MISLPSKRTKLAVRWVKLKRCLQRSSQELEDILMRSPCTFGTFPFSANDLDLAVTATRLVRSQPFCRRSVLPSLHVGSLDKLPNMDSVTGYNGCVCSKIINPTVYYHVHKNVKQFHADN